MNDKESLIPNTLEELISEFIEIKIQYPLRDEFGRFIYEKKSRVPRLKI